VIRRVRPDVIVTRFSGTPRDGHGHHQSSAILAKEAFEAAADPKRFPEQLKFVEPWQAKRILWNVFSFRRGQFSQEGDQADRLDVDTGEFDAVLGFSYAEIAGMSRSQHRSQGFGAAERKGTSINSMVVVGGDPATTDFMEGVDTTWNRVPGGAAVGSILKRVEREFVPEHPENSVPLLLEAREKLAVLDHPWAAEKREQLNEAIALATGLWLDVSADRFEAVPGSEVEVEAVALNRSRFPVELLSFELDGKGSQEVAKTLEYNQPESLTSAWAVPADQPYTQPYWLRRPKNGELYSIADPEMIGDPDTPPVVEGRFRVGIGGQIIEYRRPVVYRWVDRVRGELTRSLVVAPVVSVAFAESSQVFASKDDRKVEVELTSNQAPVSGNLRIEIPDGWSVQPAAEHFDIRSLGQQVVLAFTVEPPVRDAIVEARAVARINGREISSGSTTIEYDHIPPQTLSPDALARVIRVDARMLARNVGYVMGAGDDVPEALRQLGCEVTLLTAEDLARGDLQRFDAIVTGVRAYNVRADLRANRQRLLDYAEGGGALIVQYNVTSRGGEDLLEGIGPYPITFDRGRVSVEEAPMRFLKPDHTVLSEPNRITEEDFAGWIQERGLYFASEWDDRYEPLWSANDPGEEPLSGGTLYTRYGKGVFIFTGLSFFRELPAGVPGAYRIFANFLSAARVANQ
jgi:hypothetical protein